MGRFLVSPAKPPPLCISGFRPPSPVTCSFPAPYNPLLPLAGGLAQVLPILHPYGVIFGFTCQTAPLMHLGLQAPQTHNLLLSHTLQPPATVRSGFSQGSTDIEPKRLDVHFFTFSLVCLPPVPLNISIIIYSLTLCISTLYMHLVSI